MTESGDLLAKPIPAADYLLCFLCTCKMGTQNLILYIHGVANIYVKHVFCAKGYCKFMLLGADILQMKAR